jgi:hypothetical protein
MRKFATFLILVLVFGVLASLLITIRYPGGYPQRLGPQFDERVRYNHFDYMNQEQPEMVLMGDSTLKDSVDFDLLSKELGIKTYGIATPGSTSALWYLTLKNNIITAGHKPDYLVIYTRETLLTTPEYRVDGVYFATIDEYAAEDEPLLLERSYLQQMDPLERLAARYLPVFGERAQVRSSIDYRIDHTLPVRFGCGEVCVDQVLHDVFPGAVDSDAILEAQDQSESDLWTVDRLLFSHQLPRSYLPEIARMTRENGIQLILVEMKTWRSAPSSTAALLRRIYMQNFQAYAEANGITIISFAGDPRLPQEFFPDGFHLKKEAMPFFTGLLAEALSPVLQP